MQRYQEVHFAEYLTGGVLFPDEQEEAEVEKAVQQQATETVVWGVDSEQGASDIR